MIIQPGFAQKPVTLESAAQITKLAELEAQGQGGAFYNISQLFLKLIPSNILAVAAQGQMLGLIFF